MIGTAAGRNRLGGMLFVAALLLAMPNEIIGDPRVAWVIAALVFAGIAAFLAQVGRSRWIFVAVGLAATALAVPVLPDPGAAIYEAVSRGTFIAAFFVALTAVQSAAATDPTMATTGRFLANQPPGQRYLALTMGGHLFGLVLLYGAISLLGSLATENISEEVDEKVQRTRRRRMLLAVARGFTSTLAWSPLSLSLAISLSVVPGATWAGALPYGLAGGFTLLGVGWGLDTLFKPRHGGAPRPADSRAATGWLRALRPLGLLLALILVTVGSVHLVAGVRVFGAVIVVVPLLALAWTAVQPGAAGRRLRTPMERAARFARRDVPALRRELVLLIMAGYIGSLGGALAAPAAAAAGLDLGALPTAAVLVGMFWLVPILGQAGMNPILAVSLIGPLLPAPAALGVDPAVMIFALTCGWSLSGATSPFTASVLLIANFGKVPAQHVGVRWNAAYALTCGVLISAALVVLSL